MAEIRVDEALWASTMLPEGVVERWFAADGELVVSGVLLAQVRIEGYVHEIMSPGAGRLHIFTPVNALIEPGSRIGSVAL